MKTKTPFLSSFVLTALVVAGCGRGDVADTEPQPKQGASSRVDDATKSVASSSMTPEQKQAAADYLKQGAANAQQIQKSAQGSGRGSSN